ncbi:MAG: hypothetical protein RLZZ124_1541, partial [Cyanobacteriota bacterium]
ALQVVGGRSVPGAPDELECRSGLTLARWSYTKIDELVSGGLHEAIDALQTDLNNLHGLIHDRYFVLPGFTPTATGSGTTSASATATASASASASASSHDLACAPA